MQLKRRASSARGGSRGSLRHADSPVTVALVTAVAGTAFVLARLAIAAHWNVTKFVLATRTFADPAQVPTGLHVFPPGKGYDGQFYYRLALDPANFATRAFGIRLDAPFRLQRIGFPFVSWLASGGQRAVVPYSEVAVNLAALVLLGLLGAVFARDAGRHAGWGLLVPGFWGFLYSTGRDLPEVLASLFLVSGILALRRDRPVVAGLLLAAAALTIETTLDVSIAVALVFLLEIVRRRRKPGARDLAWVLPGVAFVGWQGVVWSVTGSLPIHSDTGDNIAAPFVNAIGAAVHFLGLLPSTRAFLWFAELFVLLVVTLFAAWALARSRVPPWEKVAWALSVLVAVSLARAIWYGTANFRGFEDVYLLSVLVLIGSRHRLWVPAGLVGLAWAAIFVLHAHAL
jgi:hypothetical protein